MAEWLGRWTRNPEVSGSNSILTIHGVSSHCLTPRLENMTCSRVIMTKLKLFGNFLKQRFKCL